MADVNIVIQYEGSGDPEILGTILDRIAEAVPDNAIFGLMVDSEHRDPSDPATELSS